MTGHPRWSELMPILLHAIELEGEAAGAYLDDACHGDEALRAEVERLLRVHRRCDPVFLEPLTTEDEDEDEELRLPGDETHLAEGDRLGKYRILHRIGAGGMATVYLGEHTELETRVAIKVLPRFSAGSPERVERFRHEAVTVARLRHPGIVPIRDVGEERGLHYFVMDYVEGPTLAHFLEDVRVRSQLDGRNQLRSRQYVRLQCDWIARVAEALDHAHQKGIVHRDVKPANILLHKAQEPMLTDFGVAKNILGTSHTATGQLAGTAPYMSPEQARAVRNTVDLRSDVFSLGTVLYEALTLRQPFRGRTIEESLKNVLFRDPERIDQRAPWVPRDLVTICHKALEKEPQHRYPTAAHMAGDLRSFLAGGPILANPPSLWRRSRVMVRRRRVELLSGAVLALAAAIVLLLGSWRRWREGTQGRVSIRSDVSGGARVLLQSLDPATRSYGRRAEVGRTPFEERLTPGHYRFTLVAEDGTFRELSALVRAGDLLEARVDIGTPPETETDMIRIEAGRSAKAGDLDAFLIDRREVSNREYKRFLELTNRPWPALWSRFGYPEDLADHPVVGISWEECQAYASWAGKRLPTSEEWEYAATRPDGRRLPWGADVHVVYELPTAEELVAVAGADMAASYAQYRAHTVAVYADSHPSPLGLLHAASNVAEYTDTTESEEAAVVKGASWTKDPEVFDLHAELLTPVRHRTAQGELRPTWSVRIGFRCARSAAVEL